MSRQSYLKRASDRFLKGTRFKTPCDAVEAGVRSLEHWAVILAEEREREARSLPLRLGRPRDESDQMHAARLKHLVFHASNLPHQARP